MVETWVSYGATGAKISRVEPKDNHNEGQFDLDIDFTAVNYGQLMQNRLLVFKPAIVSRRDALDLTDSKRNHPVVLEAHSFSETVRVKLPEGFEVDELPDALKLDTSFGSYKTNYSVKDGELIFYPHARATRCDHTRCAVSKRAHLLRTNSRRRTSAGCAGEKVMSEPPA